MGIHWLPWQEPNSAPLGSVGAELNSKKPHWTEPPSGGISCSLDKARNP